MLHASPVLFARACVDCRRTWSVHTHVCTRSGETHARRCFGMLKQQLWIACTRIRTHTAALINIRFCLYARMHAFDELHLCVQDIKYSCLCWPTGLIRLARVAVRYGVDPTLLITAGACPRCPHLNPPPPAFHNHDANTIRIDVFICICVKPFPPTHGPHCHPVSYSRLMRS